MRRLIIALAVAFVCFDILVIGGLWLWGRASRSPSKPSNKGKNVLLVAKEGGHYIGEQLRFFLVDDTGVISVTNPAWLNLYHTEGKSFRLSGAIWIGEPTGEPIPDLPDGFALYIREWDSLHRYSLRTRSLEIKRRLHRGVPEPGIKQAVSFKPPVFATWIPFSAEVSADSISFQIGDQSGTISGPLDVNGANKIALAPGTRLKDLRFELTD